jgi:hypothetical protein
MINFLPVPGYLGRLMVKIGGLLGCSGGGPDAVIHPANRT